jgi:hypothetical protein
MQPDTRTAMDLAPHNGAVAGSNVVLDPEEAAFPDDLSGTHGSNPRGSSTWVGGRGRLAA